MAPPIPSPSRAWSPGPAWRRLAAALRTSDGGLLGLALVIGASTGLAAIGFRWLIVGITRLLTGYRDYSAEGRVGHGWWPALGPWFVLLTPVVAGLLYGPLVQWGAREARGHGVPEVMLAVAQRGGRIKPRVAVVKALASALTIGGGGSVGREGPIVQIGSALGSTLGQWVRVPEDRLRVLVACGAAGGIAATFNAPLAGVVFALEIILRDFAARSFGMVVVSSVAASVVGRAALGNAPFLDLPQLTVHHLAAYAVFAVLGVLGGGAGVLFTRVLYAVEDLCDRVWRGPEWLRPGAGGLLLGLVLLAVPQMYGVGYPVLGNAVAGRYAIGFLVVLLLAKVLATSLTLGIGGSGGVFAPSLFLGAVLGAALGQASADLFPDVIGAPGAVALVGMGAVFAGSARAPITAVLIVFELTGEYGLILPLMTAVVLSTGVSHLLSRDSVYTAKLSRRGIDLTAHPDASRGDWARTTTVGRVMRAAPPLVTEGTRPADLRAVAAERGSVAVVDAGGGLIGLVPARTVADLAAEGDAGRGTVRDLTVTVPTVGPSVPVAEALDLLDRHDLDGVPVVDGTGRPVGWFSGQAVLAALTDRTTATPPTAV
ncbi:chloride channel protein [Modestobacter sp. NPDC049651]|uniref:chloride channel protein n=1 Tax=unclassified Modestobacter TaxID=2643866 RepID=UPI0033D170D8